MAEQAHEGHAGAPHAHRHGSVAVTLAAAAVIAATVGARAAIVLGNAGDELQGSVRTDVKRDAALVALDPEEKARAGAREAWHGNLDGATTLAPALAFLVAAFAEAFGGRRRLLPIAWALLLVGVVTAILWELWLP